MAGTVGWKDQDWAELLACMKRCRVIPVIGEELLQVEIDGKASALYPWIASALATSLEVPATELPTPPSLNEVVCRYLSRADASRNSIYTALSILMDELKGKLAAPPALRQLAEITDFSLFITTTFDSLMEEALHGGRQKEPCSLAYSPGDRQDIPRERDLTRATVYHLLGILDVSPTYVVSQEDLFEWSYAMESQPRPNNLFDALKKSHLLILGASYSNWLPRFLRLRTDKRLSEGRDAYEYLADSSASDNPDLVFLRHFSKQTRRYEGGAVRFVDELWNRWTRSRPAGSVSEPLPLPPEPPRGAIFISYASEDADAAQRIKAGLDAAGLDVWYDKTELQGGDAWAPKITANINRCSYFLPLISRNSVGKRDRFFIDEWNCALIRARRYLEGDPFIIPVLLDDTDIQSAAVPEAFKNAQANRLPEGKVTPDFAERMTRLKQKAAP
jgi:hypothetical protein